MFRLTFILSFLPLIVFSQFTFDKRYNKDFIYSLGEGLIETNDYYISYGSRGDFSQTDTVQPFFLVTDKKGNIINNTLISNNTCLFEIVNYQKTKNNSFIGVGYTNTSGDTCGTSINGYPVRTRMYLHKLDALGNLIWQRNYGDTILDNKWMTAKDISKTSDGNYFILGKNSGKILILKINDQGDSITSKTFNFGTVWTDLNKIEKVENGYLCFFNDYVMKINEELDSLWTKQINISTDRIKPTFDGGFILCSNSYTSPIQSTFLLKIDNEANILWSQNYHSDNIVDIQKDNIYSGNCITETTDGNFVSAYKDIIKVSRNGEFLWKHRHINDNLFFFYNDVIETQDGGFLLTGRTGTTFQTILTKIDCEGNLEWSKTSCLLPTEEDVLVFPNPIENELTFQLSKVPIENKIRVIIYNSIGQKVSELATENKQIISLNTSSYKSGVYIYSILLNGINYKSGKIIKN